MLLIQVPSLTAGVLKPQKDDLLESSENGASHGTVVRIGCQMFRGLSPQSGCARVRFHPAGICRMSLSPLLSSFCNIHCKQGNCDHKKFKYIIKKTYWKMIKWKLLVSNTPIILIFGLTGRGEKKSYHWVKPRKPLYD